ncbi:asparagine synthase [Streptomyces azureus]|uniref:asparagine synthase (glutamine-hydrolyzing) n=1 Tax=Streptomyces azureus TaxID=146537 RepID=A0A0K8PGF4_STRAJ|nr:asparagine synthase [Streptomyces azureus]
MTETMGCCGPDDRGVWAEGPAGLGHRRLLIIDLPGGRQPMTAAIPHGTVALVYSGEAYNLTELRGELTTRGHRFTTDSDTEVVLRGHLEWGDAVAERVNGMYAFAVWDGRTDRLVLIRDRMGIKPLYYHPTPDGVLFGSESKAILANPLARRRVASRAPTRPRRARSTRSPSGTRRRISWRGRTTRSSTSSTPNGSGRPRTATLP